MEQEYTVRFNFALSLAQDAWVRRKAFEQRASKVDIVRGLLDRAMKGEAHQMRMEDLIQAAEAGRTLRQVLEATYGKTAETIGVEGAELDQYQHDLDSPIVRIYVAFDESGRRTEEVALVAGDTIWQDCSAMNMVTSIDEEIDETFQRGWTLVYPASLRYEVVEDNAGSLHLFVFDRHGDIAYASPGWEHTPGLLSESLARLDRTGTAEGWEGMDYWEGMDTTPEESYATLHSWIDESMGGAHLVADQDEIYWERMGTAARKEFVAGAARQHLRGVDDYLTTYSDGRGVEHEAIQLPWGKVEAILGRKHTGGPMEDEILAEVLLTAGAPEWVQDAAGWVDDYGWGLIGPAITEDA